MNIRSVAAKTVPAMHPSFRFGGFLLAALLGASLAVLPARAEDGPALPRAEAGEIGERRVTATSSITLDGEALNYTTTAGTLLVRDEKGEPVAELFYVAHHLDGEDPNQRPITF